MSAVVRGALALALACAAGGAYAQVTGWPAKTVRIVAPFAPGGSADTLGRLVATRLADSLKQSFIVENRPGAGGVIGSEFVAKSAPDGYTFVVSGVASHVIAPATAKVPFDPLRDFTHIALFGGPPVVLVVGAAVPARDVSEFVTLAKAQRLSYGSPGNGTQGHLIAELFKQAAGIELTHVPYKGASLAVADVVADHLPASSNTLATAGSMIRAGRLRALALTAAQRLSEYPDVPTFAELGYPELVATTWFALSGPAGVPPEIVAKLNAEVLRALHAPELRERLRMDGAEPNDLDAAAFTEFVRAEIARWTPVVRASSARSERERE
ncbi:MAG TPA: tripartite tricarboxylate transporter substrate binding protein [Burkholderiales bacterium]|nr:tripartite tricarboxylate transporter substrate binding protein [Burkholderiales bacterium]